MPAPSDAGTSAKAGAASSAETTRSTSPRTASLPQRLDEVAKVPCPTQNPAVRDHEEPPHRPMVTPPIAATSISAPESGQISGAYWRYSGIRAASPDPRKIPLYGPF